MASITTEHNGAKNGGGFWGTRRIAKKVSKRLRRIAGKKEIERSPWVRGPVARGGVGRQTLRP